MSHTLLLADPSATIRRVVEMTFANTEVEVLSAVDGEQAIQCIAEKRPDIVLADIAMPKRSGYDVCEWVKSRDEHKQVPVLLLAGAFEPVDDARARDAGCNGVLVKPFEPQHVIARVQELLGGAIGGPTQATADVPRPAVRLTPPRPVELPSRRAGDDVPNDLVDIDAGDFEPPDTDGGFDEPAPGWPASVRGGDGLDDYFDQLNEAVASVGDRSGVLMPIEPEPAGETVPAPALDVGGDDAGTDGELPTLEDLLMETGDAPDIPGDDLDTSGIASDWGPDVPTFDDLLGGSADGGETGSSVPPDGGETSRTIADAFSALLASDLASVSPSGTAAPIVSDELVEEVVRRVTERLAAEQAATIEQVVARAVREAVVPAVQEAVGPAVHAAVNAAVAGAVPTAIEGAAPEVARAADAAVARVVVQVVTDAAERFVGDEIARIRAKAYPDA